MEQIIITRPLVCTGKEIGSLPGELEEKIAPYLLPMKENLKFFLEDRITDTMIMMGEYTTSHWRL